MEPADARLLWFQKVITRGLDISDESFTHDLNKVREEETPKTYNHLLLEFVDSKTPIDSTLIFYLGEKLSADDPVADDSALSLLGADKTKATQELCCTNNLLVGASASGRMGFRQVYFVKVCFGPIKNCEDSTQIEYGVLTGEALEDLSGMIRELYLPLLSTQSKTVAKGTPESPKSSSSSSSSESSSDSEDEEEKESQTENDENEKSGEGKTKEKEEARAAVHIHEGQLSLKRELHSNMQKFELQIEHALQQVNGELHLFIPDVAIDNLEAVADDYETVSQLEEALEEWSRSVAAVVEQETRKVPQRTGPLAEIEFWRKRNAALSSIYEQISMPNVQRMLKALEMVEANMLPTFRYHFLELNKLYVEAMDNVKFLITLERHFKNISGVGGTLASILDTLPSMMNSIRMVWIISRHYNTDERMVPLMERIASEIADKVASEINIRTVLRKDPDLALKTIDEAKSVLETWYKTYMHVRERIEASGSDHRWEFDRKRLFEQTNYMAKICENLHEVAIVLDQFQKFLGPELKAVTGDSEGIDEVIRQVGSLLGPLETVPFDIFDRRYKTSWEAVMAQFRDKVEEIEGMTKDFINTSFQKLRSAEGAFDLLQNFQTIQSRESINKQMMQKFDDILLQYSKEIDRIENIFVENRDNPPVFKNYPPIAGAISWAEHLYYRAKRPIMRFKTMETLFKDSETWQTVMSQYMSLSRDIKYFKKDLFNGWEEKAYTTSLLLQQPIFGPALVEVPITGTKEGGNISNNLNVGANGSGNVTYKMPAPPYYVNFNDDLVRLIRETKYLDRMGYKVPEAALNVALQEEKYHGYVQSLKQMLSNYDALLAKLSPVEQRLVSGRLEEVQNELMVGFDPCNWCSLHIPTLIERCTKVINEFQSVVSQIHKSSTMIEEVVKAVENETLVEWDDFIENLNKSGKSKDTNPQTLSSENNADESWSNGESSIHSDGTIDISVLYERIEKTRVAKLESLSRKYKSIGPLLVKVEEIVVFTNSGASPVLDEYYKYWEKRMYNAITTMVLRGMLTLQALLNMDSDMDYQKIAVGIEVDELTYKSIKRAPLCKVTATLNGSSVVVTPALTDIFKYLKKCVRNQVESAKVFVRWMNGTCKECTPQIVHEDEEPIIFSFYSDISKNPHVIKLMLALNHAYQKDFSFVRRYLDSWQSYDNAYGLWNTKKKEQLDKLLDKDRSCVYFDTRLALFERLAETVRSQKAYKDIDFIRVDGYAVAVGIAEKAREWQADYGRILYKQSLMKLGDLTGKMKAWREGIEDDPNDLESLKLVLNHISSINESNMMMEIDIGECMENFRTLSKFKLASPDILIDQDPNSVAVDGQESKLTEQEVSESFLTAQNLQETWRDLVIDSKTKDLRLNKVKDEFRDVTQQGAEDFVVEVQTMMKEFKQDGPGTKGSEDGDLDIGVDQMHEYTIKLQRMFQKREDIVNAQKLFNLPITSYPELNQVKAEMARFQTIYGLYTDLVSFEKEMSGMLWSELDVLALSKGAENLEKQLRKSPKDLRQLSIFEAVEECIVRFRDSIPLLQSLKNDSMKKRHWDTLSKITGVKFEMDPKTFTLGALFEMKLARFEADIAEIVNEAMQETKIEKSINEIEQKWRDTNFVCVKYKKNGQDKGFVLRAAEDIKLELEDNLLNLQTMAASRFVVSFAETVKNWEKSLNHVSETIDIWFKVQSKWMYLESIFIGAEDIRMQLPEEAKRFDAVDKAFKAVMTATSKNPNVVEACHAENRIDTLNALSERLDQCQKSLSDYLDTKRNAFPRFFFVSDDELLSVLGSSDPTAIQVHMLKLFDNCKLLQFARGAKGVNGMESSEGECFSYSTVAPVEGAVETWMSGVEAEMKASLRLIAKEGVFEYANMNRVEWVDRFIGMVGIMGSQVWWTWEVEDVFRRVREGDKHAMKILADKLTGQLDDLVNTVRQDISKHMRKKVNSLLIIDVHARDIVDTFVRDSILDQREFAWESQLRFYWDRDVDDIVIRQCTGSFSYGYEFMGLNGRLVITPLTDRCYMTITQAHTFNLGTAPAGPAGTGKTETVKDLAKGMALPCFVINCGEGLDYKAMGSIFSGLAQIGAWGCFDEFNRINIEVLSVVSAQLQAIQGGLKAGRKTCDIGMGQEISLDPKIGVFVTMNPGYAGRTELPDNLKALFRPVTMIVPDLLQICEIMLFSEGFGLARILAKKMTTLYALAKGQLSKQYHYDFALRALKSVLVMAGGLKRQYADMSEDLVLMRALRDSNMPKFVFDDVPLFQGLIVDLFPGLDCPRVAFEELKVTIEADLETKHFRPSNEEIFQLQVDKTIQMYETMLIRHTCMIVGPTGGGKSVVLETLKNAQAMSFGQKVVMNILNPKAQTLPELYGELDPVTRDWTDGVLSNLFRSMNGPLPAGKENEIRWLIFDGDVDALWIENMNSVMDDNRLLTLPNGERIRLQPYCKLVMETYDLQYASPATISRCGMVYVDPKNLGYLPYYERWLRLRAKGLGFAPAEGEGDGDDDEESPVEQENGVLMELFERYVPTCIDFVLEGLVGDEIGPRPDQVIPISNLSMVKQMCNLLDALLAVASGRSILEEKAATDEAGGENEAVGETSEVKTLSEGDIEGLFVFAVTWSIGGALLGNSREAFHNIVAGCSTVGLPENLYDFFFDPETGRWENWKSKVPEYEQPAPFEFSRIMVPTRENVLYTYMLKLDYLIEKPILFVGEPGTAKTVTIQNFLDKKPQEKSVKLNINFSSRTTSFDVQNNIVDNVDKRSGKIYGPPAGKKLLIFIDDMNMPIVDTYGTQAPIALLHFLVGKGTMYDRGKELDLRTYKDLQFYAAMGPPGGGRNPVDTRFISLFNVFNLTPPSMEVLTHIYSSIIETYLSTGFDDSVKSCGAKFTAATLSLYNSLISALPPTPAKFHYVFNLRDLGRVYEGVCLATPDNFEGQPGKFVRLWRNEVTRILFDRLISEEDIKFANEAFEGLLKENFSEHVDSALVEPMMFGDFKYAAARITEEKEDPQLYDDMGDYKSVRKIFDEILECYNMDNKPMALVLFEMALDHLTRIYRIIRIPIGHALLVGVGGSGKQSLTKLATFAAGSKIFEITLSRGYGETEFREDLKELYKMLLDGPVTFLFTDAHVVEEGFLELINNMLTTGMVPALFENDEKDACCNGVRAEVKALGMFDTKDNLWNYYVKKCRNNLHIILAMSPSGDTLRVRCRNFPGLVSGCVIDWFFPWPADALRNVANYFLQDEPLPEKHRENIVEHMVVVHESVIEKSTDFFVELRRHNYVTPKNYLDFISNYRFQMKENKRKNEEAIKRLGGGLTKLQEAEVSVDAMSKELSVKKVVVEGKTKDCQALIEDIDKKQSIASEKQEDASNKKAELEESGKIIQVEKAKADESLEEALPALEAAAEALENLNKNDITEIKAFANPPDAVMAVCMCVLLLKPTGTEDDNGDWKACKAMMSQGNFLAALKGYDKDGISDKQIKKVKKYFQNKDFNAEKMATISKAGLGLFTWVTAIVKYNGVAKNVEPLRKKVAALEKQQNESEIELANIMATLKELEESLAVLSKNFEEANGELTALRDEAQLMEKRLTAASKLISGLSSEKARWSSDVKVLEGKSIEIIGDCLLGASFLSYLGVFTSQYRETLIQGTWKKDIAEREIPIAATFSIEALLTTDVEIQKWSGEGLPGDPHSIQNGILTTNSSRFPMCIDPQQQAVKWIKKKESANNLTVRTFSDSDFMKHLELAIQFGNPFLFENVDEELDPMVDPVLEKNTISQNGQLMIVLGDKTVDWDANFRLYLTTKLANPHYTPEVMGKTMIINYSVTISGLADQLLNVVVGHERPDIEEKFADIVTQMSDNTQALAALEDTLLQTLASSTGNILDNEELILTLDEAKTKSVDIKAQIENATFTKEEIQTARKEYTPVAVRGSILFFAMSGLSTISKMYETSLSSFLGVFQKALDDAKKDSILDQRLENMIEESTRQIYDYTCTGIFEKHKLMFSMQMTCMIMEGYGELNRTALDFFLKGETAIAEGDLKKPADFISDAGWRDLLKLEQIDQVFEGVVENVKKNVADWQAWYELETPETEPLPQGYNDTVAGMNRLLITRCFRPDRVYNAVKLFIMGHPRLGEKYVQPPVLDFKRIYNQSSAIMPMVFILSPGADPASDIQVLGEEMGFSGGSFKTVSLGQGQGPVAMQMLETGASRGHWVLLQNCHLLVSWLRKLEGVLETMTKVNENFRLWLTTDPTDKFPMGILQRSLKVVTEPPDGLKLNMRSTFSKIDETVLEECDHEAYRPLVYVLSYLHAVVQERRKYGKIGWNVAYDFNESDFKVSRRLLCLYLNKAVENNDEMIPWGSLKYLIGDAMYGGRVSDNYDRRVLVTYVNEYMGDFLFDDCQKFFFSHAGYDYDLPGVGPVEIYKASVEKLPLSCGPSVFGLHPNAEIGYLNNATKDLWRNLIDLQPRTATAKGGLSREDVIEASANNIAKSIPEPIDILVLKKKFGVPSPTQIVLLQELERWNNLVLTMANSLVDLKKALKGEIGMSEQLDGLATSLFNGFLPGMWRRLCPDTQKPLGSWIQHFQHREQQYNGWIEDDEPKVMWLSGLHIPESYLTALVQATCRMKNWPLDKSTLYTKVTRWVEVDQVPTRPEFGCYVVGLYLEGAAWNLQSSCLEPQKPKVLVQELPILQVIPVEASKLKLQGTFKTPVYVTQARRNAMGVGLVFSADLATDMHESHWVLQGVSLSLNVDT